MKKRCAWVSDHPIYIDYHDKEWGVPVHDDKKLFEAMILDTFQAGLSWLTVLRKRENFRKAFDNFEPERIANWDDQKIQSLLLDEGIIRNKLKIMAAVSNAMAFLKIREEHGSFSNYIWQFTGHKTICNHWENIKQIPASTKESHLMSKDLKKKGFKFVGTTICYAFMQATGMVCDHTKECFRYGKCI